MTTRVRVGPVAVLIRGVGARADAIVEDVGRYLYAGSAPANTAPANTEPELRLDVEIGAGSGGPWDTEEALATFDNGFILGRDGEAVVLRGGGCYARLDVRDGVGRVQVPKASGRIQHWVACAVVLEGLLILLRRHGWFSVHAAALAHRGRGIVLAAAADSGKSTLALRLVQQGWGYLSDDTVLLGAAGELVEMRGLRAHFSVDPEAEALFPGIEAGREKALLKEEKWALNVEALYPERRVEVSTPHALVFPRIEDAYESRLDPISKVDAFGLLLVQSSLAQVKLDHAEDHLATLGRFVGQADTYRLHAGRDLLEDPSRADALLGSLLGPTFPTP